jgi:RHS repeat-associated protein
MYTPYGTAELLGTTSPFPLPSYGWTGREYDAETGFYYMRARYYDLTEMRFTQEDPAGAAGGQNHYAYVGGAVLSATDPSGALPVPDKYRWIHAGVAPIHGWDDWGWFTDANWYSYDGTSVLYSERLMSALQALDDAYQTYQHNFDAIRSQLQASGIQVKVKTGEDVTLSELFSDLQQLDGKQFEESWLSAAAGAMGAVAAWAQSRLLHGEVGVGDKMVDLTPADGLAGASTMDFGGWQFSEYHAWAFGRSDYHALEAHETMHSIADTFAYYTYGTPPSEAEVCYAANRVGYGALPCF